MSGIGGACGYLRSQNYYVVADDRHRLRSSGERYVQLPGAVIGGIQDDDVVVLESFD